MILLGTLNVSALLITILIGAVCGFLAGNLMKGGSMGLLPNIVVGVIGAAIFSYLFGSLSLIPNVEYVNEIIGGTIGSVILLFGLSLLRKATS